MVTIGRRASVPSLDGVGFARLVVVGRYGNEPIPSAVSPGNSAGHPLALFDGLGSGTPSTAAYEAGAPVLPSEVLGGSDRRWVRHWTCNARADGVLAQHRAVVYAIGAREQETAPIPQLSDYVLSKGPAARGVCCDPEDIG